MHAITVRTRRALTPSGLRNELTVFEIASTPVSEAPPLANARSSTSTVAPITRPSPCPTGTAPTRCAESYCGRPHTRCRSTPVAIITVIMTMKK